MQLVRNDASPEPQPPQALIPRFRVADVTVRFPCPWDHRIVIERVVSNVSERGLGFLTSPLEDLVLLPDEEVAWVEVAIGDRRISLGPGQIRHVSTGPDGEVCGVALTEAWVIPPDLDVTPLQPPAPTGEQCA